MIQPTADLPTLFAARTGAPATAGDASAFAALLVPAFYPTKAVAAPARQPAAVPGSDLPDAADPAAIAALFAPATIGAAAPVPIDTAAPVQPFGNSLPLAPQPVQIDGAVPAAADMPRVEAAAPPAPAAPAPLGAVRPPVSRFAAVRTPPSTDVPSDAETAGDDGAPAVGEVEQSDVAPAPPLQAAPPAPPVTLAAVPTLPVTVPDDAAAPLPRGAAGDLAAAIDAPILAARAPDPRIDRSARVGDPLSMAPDPALPMRGVMPAAQPGLSLPLPTPAASEDRPPSGAAAAMQAGDRMAAGVAPAAILAGQPALPAAATESISRAVAWEGIASGVDRPAVATAASSTPPPAFTIVRAAAEAARPERALPQAAAMPGHWAIAPAARAAIEAAAPVAPATAILPAAPSSPPAASAAVGTALPILPPGDTMPTTAPQSTRAEGSVHTAPPLPAAAAVAGAVGAQTPATAADLPSGATIDRAADRGETRIEAAAPATPIAPPAAAQAAAPPTIDVRHERWPHDMVAQIERLRDAADAVDTRIRLLPDRLGQVEVDVRREGDTLHVRFNAEQPQTRALLQDAQPRLAEAAESRGLKLGQASVDGGTGQQSQRQPAAPPPAPPRARTARREHPDTPTADARVA